MNDEINNPSHYKIFPDMEVIDIIRKTLSDVEFAGYCKGNSIKYRLRAGEKGPAEICIGKARKYEEWLKESVGSSILGLLGVASGHNLSVETPWYPDDSGEWVEHDGGPCPIDDETIVEHLWDAEREEKEYTKMESRAGKFFWQNIVAYKVIK